MIGTNEWVGIIFFVLATVFGFLFVYPKSPVRRRWWSISDKLSITSLQADVDNKKLRVYIGIRTLSDIRIESIKLKIMGKLLVSDWEPKSIVGDDTDYGYWGIPDKVPRGKHIVYMVAVTKDGFSKSPRFSIDC